MIRDRDLKQLAAVIALALALLAIGVGTYAAVISRENTTEITQIQHSACQVEPEGQECQLTKITSAKAESVHTACIPFHQVAKDERLLDLTKCQKEVMPSSNPSSGNSLPGPVESGPTGEPEAAPEPTPEHPIKEAVGGVLEETGAAVNGTVEGLTCQLRLTC